MNSRFKPHTRLHKTKPNLIVAVLIVVLISTLVACGIGGQRGHRMMEGGMMGRYQADSSSNWSVSDKNIKILITGQRAEEIINQYIDGLGTNVKAGQINDVGQYFEAELIQGTYGEIFQIITVNKTSGELEIIN